MLDRGRVVAHPYRGARVPPGVAMVRYSKRGCGRSSREGRTLPQCALREIRLENDFEAELHDARLGARHEQSGCRCQIRDRALEPHIVEAVDELGAELALGAFAERDVLEQR